MSFRFSTNFRITSDVERHSYDEINGTAAAFARFHQSRANSLTISRLHGIGSFGHICISTGFGGVFIAKGVGAVHTIPVCVDSPESPHQTSTVGVSSSTRRLNKRRWPAEIPPPGGLASRIKN